MTRRLIGTGTTDAQGRCVIEYTGTGAGLVNLQAEYSNEKDTIMSEICNIYDCLIADTGISGTSTDLFNHMELFERSGDGTRVYYENTGSSTYQINLTSLLSISGDTVIEFELLECSYCNIQTGRYADGVTSAEYEQCLITNHTGLVRIEILTTGTYFYLDGTLIRSDVNETRQDKVQLFFRALSGTTLDFKYKNLKIYPI